MAKKRLGDDESKRRSEQDTTLRCLNCFNRIKLQPGTRRISCSGCGEEFMIGWRGKGKRQAKILGVPIPGKHA
jgi:DNA-directed RNA polymerase subunit RPC12/RpoP